MPASRLSGHPTGILFAYVSIRVCVGTLFACVYRGSSPSQLMNRQSPRRYAINRLGNRSENRSTRLTPTKTRVAFVAASPCSTTVCLGSESGVEGQLESPGGAARRFQASNLLRDPLATKSALSVLSNRPGPTQLRGGIWRPGAAAQRSCCYGGTGLGRCARGSGCFGVPWCSAVRPWQAGPGGGRGANARPEGGMNWHRGLGKQQIWRVLEFFGCSVVSRGRSGPGPAIRGSGPVPRRGAAPGQTALYVRAEGHAYARLAATLITMVRR
jgi:hypothetical protein